MTIPASLQFSNQPSFNNTSEIPIQSISSSSYTAIGIATAVCGNLIISVALNVQKYAHLRLQNSSSLSSCPSETSLSSKKLKSPCRSRRVSRTPSNSSILSRNASTGACNHTPFPQPDNAQNQVQDNDNSPKVYTNLSSNEDSIDSSIVSPSNLNSINESLNNSISSSSSRHGHEHYASTRQDQQSDRDNLLSPTSSQIHRQEQSYLKSGIWWLGTVLMTIGETGNFVAYGFAPASIVSPLGVLALAANCIIAPLFFNESIAPRNYMGVAITSFGILLIITSVHPSESQFPSSVVLLAAVRRLISELSPHDFILDAISQPSFQIYLAVVSILIIILLAASPLKKGFFNLYYNYKKRHSTSSLAGSENNNDSSNYTGETQPLLIQQSHNYGVSTSTDANQRNSTEEYFELENLFSNLGLVALFGAFTALSTKGLSSILNHSFTQAVEDPLTYALLAVLVVTAIAQVIFLNQALREYNATVVIPVHFVFFTISVITGSAITFHDFENCSAMQLAQFFTGCMLTFVGVWFITASSPDNYTYESDNDTESYIHQEEYNQNTTTNSANSTSEIQNNSCKPVSNTAGCMEQPQSYYPSSSERPHYRTQKSTSSIASLLIPSDRFIYGSTTPPPPSIPSIPGTMAIVTHNYSQHHHGHNSHYHQHSRRQSTSTVKSIKSHKSVANSPRLTGMASVSTSPTKLMSYPKNNASQLSLSNTKCIPELEDEAHFDDSDNNNNTTIYKRQSMDSLQQQSKSISKLTRKTSAYGTMNK